MTYTTAASQVYTNLETLNDILIYEELGFITWNARKKTGKLSPPIQPGREYLGKKARCSIRTVSRSTSRLEKLGFLRKSQHRRHDGTWRSNWYRLAAGQADRIRYVLMRPFKGHHRGTRMAHITKNINNLPSTPDQRGRFFPEKSASSCLQGLRERAAAGKDQANAPPPAGTFGRGE